MALLPVFFEHELHTTVNSIIFEVKKFDHAEKFYNPFVGYSISEK